MLALLLPLLLSWSFAAEFTVPALTGPVVDSAGVMNAQTRETLAAFLQQHRAQGGAQIQVVSLPSLEGLSIEEASIKIADQWQIGQAKEDRGVILVMAYADRRVRIEVGKGLEGDLTDARSSRIVREVIIPRLRSGDVDRAIVDGVLAIAHYADPNIETSGAVSSGSQRRSVRGLSGWKLLIFWVLIFLFFVGPGRRFGWLFLLAAMSGGGGRHRGGGSFGGGGGGWSGGGGGFNGGGSSGSW